MQWTDMWTNVNMIVDRRWLAEYRPMRHRQIRREKLRRHVEALFCRQQIYTSVVPEVSRVPGGLREGGIEW